MMNLLWQVPQEVIRQVFQIREGTCQITKLAMENLPILRGTCQRCGGTCQSCGGTCQVDFFTCEGPDFKYCQLWPSKWYDFNQFWWVEKIQTVVYNVASMVNHISSLLVHNWGHTTYTVHSKAKGAKRVIATLDCPACGQPSSCH